MRIATLPGWVLGALSLVQTSIAAASEAGALSGATTQTEVNTEPVRPRRSPIFVLAPTASVEVSRNVFFSTALGITGLVAVNPSIRLGISAVLSQNVTNSMEGCSIVPLCVRSWQRLSATFEYHHFPKYEVDFWWGAQAGLERLQGELRDLATGYYSDEKLTFAVVQPNLGVDFSASEGHGYFGVGIFFGMPISLGSDMSGMGLMLGVRGLLGGQ